MGYLGLLYVCQVSDTEFHLTIFDPNNPGREDLAEYKIIDGKELPTYLKNFFVSVAERC